MCQTKSNAALAEQITRFLTETHRAKQPVNLRMYDATDDMCVIGLIERFDPEAGRFMVDGKWFEVVDILEMGFAK